MNKSLSMYADMIFKHGVVVTVDKENSICEAAAVKGNKIVYVGDDAGVEMWKGENTKVIDLNGRALLHRFAYAPGNDRPECGRDNRLQQQ